MEKILPADFWSLDTSRLATPAKSPVSLQNAGEQGSADSRAYMEAHDRLQSHAFAWQKPHRRSLMHQAMAGQWSTRARQLIVQQRLSSARLPYLEKVAHDALSRAEGARNRSAQFEDLRDKARFAVENYNTLEDEVKELDSEIVRARRGEAAAKEIAHQAKLVAREIRNNAVWRREFDRLVRDRNETYSVLCLPVAEPPPEHIREPETVSVAVQPPQATVQLPCSAPAPLPPKKLSKIEQLRERFAHVREIVDDEGEAWPNPHGLDRAGVIAAFVQKTRTMGAYGGDWHLDALAHVLNTPVVVWKQQPGGRIVKVQTCGPRPEPDQAPRHILLRHMHYLAFCPHRPCRWDSKGEAEISGDMTDYGGGGDCLYHAMGQTRSKQEVQKLRHRTADIVSAMMHDENPDLGDLLYGMSVDRYDNYCLRNG